MRAGAPTASSPDDIALGNSERLVAAHAQDFWYFAAWKSWLTWDGTRWRQETAGKVEHFAKQTVRGIYRQAASEVDPERRAELAKWAWLSESNNRPKAMVDPTWSGRQ